MDYLWAPWRSTYMKDRGSAAAGCIFCAAAAAEDNLHNLVVYRGKFSFILLNRYPYTSGHVMIAPFDHISRLQAATSETALEIMSLTRAAERVIEEAYRPDGLNLGMNLGEAAGAGIEQHIHMHLLPRWWGDSNFITTVGDTRILPETLEDTYQKIQKGFAGLTL
jgi:ATP adenylyltransferase